MNRLENIFAYLLVAVLFAFLLIKGVRPACQSVHSDFANYYVSAKLIANAEPIEKIYDNDWFQAKIHECGIDTPGKFAPFPPITSFVMVPLTFFSPLHAQQVFVIVNLCFAILGVWVIRKITGWSWRNGVLLMLLCGLGLANNFAFGQLYLIMAVGVLCSIALAKNEKIKLAAVTLALIAAIKYFAITVVASYLLLGLLDLRNKRMKENVNLKVGLYSAGFLMLIACFQFFYFGEPIVAEYVQSSLMPHMGGDLHGQNPFSFQFQSWESLLRNVFIVDAKYNPHPLMSSALAKTALMWLIKITIAATTGFTLYKFAHRGERDMIFISIPLLAAMTLLPASATYHFVILIVPLCLLLSSMALTRREKLILVLLFSLIGFIPYSLFFRMAEIHIVFAFPRLFLITLLYCFVTWRLLLFSTGAQIQKNEKGPAL